jgi:hypothetical protein
MWESQPWFHQLLKLKPQLKGHISPRLPRQHGTTEKPQLDCSRLQDIWQQQAIQQGWDPETAQVLQHARAPSTQKAYNSALRKCKKFCDQHHKTFPPHCTADLARFLDVATRGASRPLNTIKRCCAALASLDDKDIPLEGPLIIKMKQALVSSRTTLPQKSGDSNINIEKILDYIHKEIPKS